jgi:signal transduction histidine kinase
VGLFVDKPLYRLVRNNEECDAKVINSKKDEIFYPLYIYCRQPDKKGDTFLNRTEYIYRSMLDNHDSKEYYVMDLKIKSATKNDQKALIIIYRNFETDQEIHEALNAFAYHASSALSNSILYFNIKNLNFCLTRALENLEKTQKELVQSEKMAALGRLSAQIAHEVRNPLGTIKVSAVTLLENSNDNENMKTLSRFIACEVDRLNNVVSGLLDFSKVRSIKKQKVLLREFKEKLIHLVSHDMDKKNIHFSFDLNNYETAFFDYDSILQVLHNLVLNSIDALKESADALKESADALKESADENYKGTISILLEKQSDYFIFYVRDNGPGFKDDPQKAFEPFYTSKTRGTGLGLAVCRQIAELHGGTVRINDSTPTGACVVISLPV